MIQAIRIQNFKIFRDFAISLNDDITIVVGDNEAGKSTILEAVGLALTKRLHGKLIDFEINTHLFNKEIVSEYLAAVAKKDKPPLPHICIEVYFSNPDSFEHLRGSNNSHAMDTCGVKLEIVFNDDYADEYIRLLEKPESLKSLPTEYYKVQWTSFANNSLTSRSVPVGVSNIDAATIRFHGGADLFFQDIINGSLTDKEKVSLSLAYRNLKETFSSQPEIGSINEKLTARQQDFTEKKLSISIDTSQKSNWENSMAPHVNELPFQFIGKGEQSTLKVLLALERDAEKSQVILVEEPENHLSFSRMAILIRRIKEKCQGKQIIIVTHSAYVLNKLGLEKVVMLHGQRSTSLSRLPSETYDYFKKLSGYDTLRLILAKKAILVEGPSDELVVQKAFLLKHKVLPLSAGVDVINIRGLSFVRFLEIASVLGNEVHVVTDNDGDYEKNVVKKYASYTGFKNIRIHADTDTGAQTLEPQLLKANGLTKLNAILGRSFQTEAELLDYMASNKTETALAIFGAREVTCPQYVNDAVA